MPSSIADLVFEFGLAATDLETTDDLSRRFKIVADRLGGRFFSATIIDGDIYREIGRKGFGRRNTDWVETYLAKTYADVDPVWRSVAATGRNAFWDEHLAQLPRLKGLPEEVMANARQHGLKDGYTSLVRLPGGRAVLFAVMGDQLDHSPTARLALDVCSRLYVEALARIVEGPLRPIKLDLDELTKREQEVLNAKSKGLHDHQVGILLGIRRKTVEDHLSKIRSKLGVRTTPEALIIAERAANE